MGGRKRPRSISHQSGFAPQLHVGGSVRHPQEYHPPLDRSGTGQAGPAALREWGLKGLGWELLKHPSDSDKYEMMLM